MCMYGEKICASKTIHVRGSLVIALLCVVLALIILRPLKGRDIHLLSTLTPP